MILNAEYIRRRRRDLRLSQRALAKQLGVTSQVIAALEDGTNHATLPLVFVSALAELLGLDVVDLYAREAPTAGDVDELTSQIGSFLVETGTLVAVEALADVFQVSLDEIDEALDQLSAAAEAVSLTLQRKTGGDVALHP